MPVEPSIGYLVSVRYGPVGQLRLNQRRVNRAPLWVAADCAQAAHGALPPYGKSTE